jgi:DHA2 family multidrug resistance protein
MAEEDIVTSDRPNQEWKPAFNPWLVAITVALAAFMEVLDTSIANVALPHIAGNLGASQDQATWVLTTYLLANAVVLPVVGWLSSALGRKRYFMISIALFSASSLLCGLAPGMPILLIARALQGVGGGGMQPMSQAIMADSFPPRMRAAAFALFGVTVMVAPALGPILGGWITDNFSWRWIFLINLPVGLLASGLVFKLVEDPPFLRRFKPGEMSLDIVGLSLLVVGVGALQILLDKGQEDDWLGSNFIVSLIVISALCLSALVLWELRHKVPLIDVRLFRNLNFSGVNIMMFLAGAVAFSSTVLMPQFLQTLAGYSAQQAGLVVSAGAGMLLSGAYDAGASEVPDCVRLALFRCGLVYFHSPSNFGSQLCDRLRDHGVAVCTHRLHLRSGHHRVLLRDCTGQERHGLRSDQLHPKYRQQLRRIDGYDRPGPPTAVSHGPAD